MKMIATSDGFYKGRRVREGAAFEFDENEEVAARKDGKPVLKDGKPLMVKVKAPRWAVPAAEAKPKTAAAPAGDTKPADAAAAARKKAGGADLA